MPTAGTFCHVLIFSRVVLDTLLGVLQAYVITFCIQEVSSDSSSGSQLVSLLGWSLRFS